jgi:hypothetical protein
LTANAKIQSIVDQNDGRLMFTTLSEHYVGSGLFANDITRANSIIETIFYTGEKPPHMWWDKFKADLEWAYNKVQSKATPGRIVYTEEDKLRKLPDRIKADFLAPQMAHINAQLCMIPCPITHDIRWCIANIHQATQDRPLVKNTFAATSEKLLQPAKTITTTRKKAECIKNTKSPPQRAPTLGTKFTTVQDKCQAQEPAVGRKN